MKAAALLLCVACAATPKAAPLPLLPPQLDVDALILPPPPPIEIPAHVPRFKDTPTVAGQCGPGSLPGVLVSHATFAEWIVTADERARLAREATVRARLRVEERAAVEDLDRACRLRIDELERARASLHWPSLWKGAAVGAALMAGATFLLLRGPR